VNDTPAPSTDEFIKGLWRENPVFVQVLGMCPVLAVTNTAMNALAMGLATLFVLVMSSTVVSTIRGFVPKQVRIVTFILVIATFVTLADMMLQAYAPVQHKELGAFIALIVVNCMILGRQEAFSSKNNVFRSLLDAMGTGIGFTIALVMMGGFREILGVGSFLEYPLFGPNFEPWVVMVLPAGGFLTLGFILLAMGYFEQRKKSGRAGKAEQTA